MVAEMVAQEETVAQAEMEVARESLVEVKVAAVVTEEEGLGRSG